MKQLFILILITVFGLTACKKFLAAKSDGSLALPDNVAGLQGLLISTFTINTAGVSSLTTSGDEYYIKQETFDIGGPVDQNLYTWQASNPDPNSGDWSSMYTVIYYANVVLENIDKIIIKPTEIETAKATKGSALFIRARANLELVFAFAKGYDASTSAGEPGIPLRLTTDFTQKDERSSLEVSYQQIIGDLKTAIPLLPKKAINNFQPSKAAAYGMLARTYLSMRDYSNCQLYADSSLQEKADLMDYNTIVGSPQSFPMFDMPEIEYGSTIGYSASIFLYDPYALIDSALIQSYDASDLRKTIYFSDHGDNTYSFSYAGSYSTFGNFDGMATDEVYLMRAECYARNGNITSAMNDLNTLLKNRYANTLPYVDRTASTKEEALAIILQERRKELIFRNLRWMDLKRLNLEGANITLKRILGTNVYTLPPNSPRYAIPIPDDVIKLSGMQQNRY